MIDVDTPAPTSSLESLLEVVDAVAEIPKALRAGAPVQRFARDPQAARREE